MHSFSRGTRTRPEAVFVFAVVLCLAVPSWVAAASKSVDLDAQSANGAESRCDLNVITSFPVKVENIVTNKAVGDAFDFEWRSAGPGGFTSSAAAGTAGGVGAKWTWTTNNTVYAFTGTTCDKDVCFLKTSGPDPLPGTCTLACPDDGVTLTVDKGTNPGDVRLTWSGGTASYTVYRSADRTAVPAPDNVLTTTDLLQYTDAAPGTTVFYHVRGSTCLERKSCTTNAECNPVTEGTCVSRGPFSVPGRSLTSTDITVSSASLTSSLITFFSPPQEVFSVTVVAQPGGTQEIQENGSTASVTTFTEAYPPGCCPANPDVPHQLNCNGTCVDYLNDPLNCGACGNVCGEGTCCVDGNCVSLCGEGQTWCNGACVDFQNDNDNCGACGNACGDGTCCYQGECASICSDPTAWCGDLCYDVQNDSDNCGACDNVCGEGTCCSGGACVTECEDGRTYCNGLCYDLQNDPNNCGACGNVCQGESVCTGGTCVPCSGDGGRKNACDNRCVNLNTDPYNCGACGATCELDCPSGFTGVCSHGQSCRCEEGEPVPPPPPNTPVPTPPVCPNPNPDPDPVAGICPNPNPSGPVPGLCPDTGPPPPTVDEAPICTIEAGSTTIPPGGSTTICRPGGVLFREVAGTISVCGDGIPGPDGLCLNSISNVAAGTFIRFVPDTETDVGDAYMTPYAVHVTHDPSNDGMIQPGESVGLLIDVVNAGPSIVDGATATMVSSPVDLTDDGVSNPVAATILSGTSSYGNIEGTQPSVNCEPVTIHPATNATAFEVTIPPELPGDVSYPFTLQFSGTVGGAPFSMDMPIAIGVADRCVYGEATRDYDGVDGLLSPMAKLVPDGDDPPFPTKALNAGKTAPLKMRQLCGGVELRGEDIDAPEIVGLSEAVLGPLDIYSLHLNDDTGTNELFFRWNEPTKQWIFNMRTSELGAGVFTLKIRLASRKDYVTGFELR